MNIGLFKKVEGDNIAGDLPSIHLTGVCFERNTERKSDKSPHYFITIEGAELGSAWVETKEKDGKKLTYLRGHIDSPLFPERAYIAVFDRSEGNYAVVWDRSKAKDDTSTEEAPSF
jgi:uncharacterized protein (DUF736 family)